LITLAVLSALLLIAFLWAFAGWQKARAAALAAHEKIAMIEEARASMADYLRAQAAESAQAVANQMVERATQTFQAQDRAARERVEAQLKPVAETLAKFQEHVTALEKV